MQCTQHNGRQLHEPAFRGPLTGTHLDEAPFVRSLPGPGGGLLELPLEHLDDALEVRLLPAQVVGLHPPGLGPGSCLGVELLTGQAQLPLGLRQALLQGMLLSLQLRQLRQTRPESP